MARNKILNYFPAALMLQPTAGGNLMAFKEMPRGTHETNWRVDDVGPTSGTPSIFEAMSTPESSNPTTGFSIQLSTFEFDSRWSVDEQKLYKKLVAAEALGTISDLEMEELASLQRTREQFENPPTDEEIISRYKRERLGREMLAVVNRYVRISAETPHPADTTTA